MRFLYGVMAVMAFLMAAAAFSEAEWIAGAVLVVAASLFFFRMERA